MLKIIALCDWVPVVFMSTLSNDSLIINNDFLSTSVTSLAREIYAALIITIPSLASGKIPPQHIEYSCEVGSSFEKHVYTAYEEGKNWLNIDSTKVYKENLKKLDSIRCLFDGEDPTNSPIKNNGDDINKDMIKKQYRKMSMKYHPDRMQFNIKDDDKIKVQGKSQHIMNQENDDDMIIKDMIIKDEIYYQNKFREIQDSYDYLSSLDQLSDDDSKRSWYESLGGKERLKDFEIVKIGKDRAKLDLKTGLYEKYQGIGMMPYETTILPIDGGYTQSLKTLTQEFMMFFVTKNRDADANRDTEKEILEKKK